MSSVPYRLSEEALQDLDQIWIHTANQWSVHQADRYYNVLLEEILYISMHPLTGRPNQIQLQSNQG